jgi:hypothetical protein
VSPYLGTHQLVSGLPARWWANAMFAFLAVTQSLDIIVFVAGVVFFREALIGFVIVAVALFVSGFIPLIAARLWGLPNDKREVAAGYTTLPETHQELDQVDLETGRVIRRAGEPFLRQRSRLARVTPVVGVVVVVVLAAYLIYTAVNATGRGQSQAIAALGGLGVGLILLVSYVLYLRAATKRNTAAAARLYPTAQLFACLRNPDLLHELRLADEAFAQRNAAQKFPRPFVLAVDAEGMHLVTARWGEPVTVTWSRITGIRHGFVKEARSQTLAAQVVLGQADDEHVLPFTIALPTTFADRDTPTDALLAVLTDGLERAARR